MASKGSADRLKGLVVAHILPYPSIGGTELGTLRVMKAVESFGVKSIAIVFHAVPELRALFETEGYQVIEWKAPEPSLRHGVRFWRESRLLAGELKTLGVDLVHCSDYLAAWHASSGCRLAGLPVLCHIRNRHTDLLFRDRLFLLPVTHFAFVSQQTWNCFSYRVGPRRGTVLYDGLALPDGASLEQASAAACAVRAEFGLPASCKLIGTVARVTPQKDFETLIEAARLVLARHPDARFLIIGDNSMTEASRNHFRLVRDRIESAGLSGHFVFTGYRSDTFRLISALDVAVLSTHHEGLPLALIETMAFAKPTIATAVDGIPELIQENLTGLLCAHEDPKDLARQVVSVLENPELASRLGSAGRESVLATFTAERFAENLASLYRNLLTQNRSRNLSGEPLQGS